MPFTGSEAATRIALRYPWPPETGYVACGRRVRHRADAAGREPGARGHEASEPAGAGARARGAARRQPIELLMFSSSGRLVSGTMSNVFIVRDGRLVTPRLDLCGVAGVMRRVVMREARQRGHRASRSASRRGARDLRGSDEMFLTNARIGVWPVAALDGRKLTIGAAHAARAGS